MKYTLIQALRGLLCVGVVFIHIKMALRGDFPIASLKGDLSFFALVPDLIGGVPCGFFAISGYFMAFLVDRESPNFLGQRLVRVYPSYIICVGLAFVFRAFTSSPLNFDNLASVLSLLPFGMGKSYKLGIEWTLVYEIAFYFACALFCRPKWSKRFPAFLLVWLFVVVLYDLVAFVPPMPVPNVLSLWVSIWDYSFIVGALTYYFLSRRSEPATMFWAGQVVLATTCAVSVLYMGGYDVLYTLGFISCLLLAGLIRLEKRIRSPKFLSQLGDYSYALYLIHPTLIILVLDRWHAYTGQPPGPVAGLFALVVSFGAFWFLGQLDVYVHRRCKSWLNRTVAEGLPVVQRSLRGLFPRAAASTVSLDRDKP